MASPAPSSMTSVASSSNLRSWLCPFDETTASTTEHHPDTHFKSGFIATATEEGRHAPVIRDGFKMYHDKLVEQRAFSQRFRDEERIATARAREQLDHLGSVFQDLVTQAANLDTDPVPEELRAELHLATQWLKKHRASLVNCHVFFKINWSLVETSDGIMEINDKDEQNIVEMCEFAVDRNRQRRSSISFAEGGADAANKEHHRRASFAINHGQLFKQHHRRAASLAHA